MINSANNSYCGNMRYSNEMCTNLSLLIVMNKKTHLMAIIKPFEKCKNGHDL